MKMLEMRVRFQQRAHQGPSRDQCSRERADEDDDYKRGNHAHDADDDAMASENHHGLHTCLGFGSRAVHQHVCN